MNIKKGLKKFPPSKAPKCLRCMGFSMEKTFRWQQKICSKSAGLKSQSKTTVAFAFGIQGARSVGFMNLAVKTMESDCLGDIVSARVGS
jgi:hypothetical protein